MKRIIYFLLLLLPPLAASAERVQIGELWYNLDAATKTAEVTHDGSVFWGVFGGYVRSTYYTGNITIPESVSYDGTTYQVVSIGEETFVICKELTSISFPNTLTTIEDFAFFECTGLTSLSFPNSLKCVRLGAFRRCENIASVHILDYDAWLNMINGHPGDENYGIISPYPESYHLYLNGEEIKNAVIPEGNTKINDFVFAGCIGLESMSIPSSVEKIGIESFEW